ncbi:MAG: DUF2569 domain-containing protein [Methylobacteriaceae bacterium]|nr:DUF2569 domain-containing protein [Methylobacteriaceae bacterium]
MSFQFAQQFDAPMKKTAKGPKGLGGWLLAVIASILIVSAIQMVVIWQYYTTLFAWFVYYGTDAFRAGFAIRVIADISLLIVACFTIMLYFKRSAHFPDMCNLWVCLLVVSSLFMDVCFMLDERIIPTLPYQTFIATKASAVLLAIIVPYLFTSERVRNTFYGKGYFVHIYQ